MIVVDLPGKYYVQVETDKSFDGYLYGPIVQGGNQLGPDGRSAVVDVTYRDSIVLNGGLYLPFKSKLVAQCEDPPGDGCGWGVWNQYTCQCDCNPGFCLSANQKCYDGCTTHEEFNPWGGCRPGIDCPWFPEKHGKSHCTSSANFAGIHNLHETAEICCKEQFGGNVNSCVQSSITHVEAQIEIVQERLTRPRYYWPDLHGKENCVFDSDYNDWMEGSHKDFYLFDNEVGCCGTWYPNRPDCPDTSPTTPQQVDYKPDPNQQFYYPHLSQSNCWVGRNYPMWMALYPKHYLYQTADECCSKWYPSSPNCPLPGNDGVQEGYYWIVDEAFYPNFQGDYCAQGNSYPEWMADPMNRDTHLFKTGKECCDMWFPQETSACQTSIVTVMDGKQIAGPDVTGTWYPSLNGHFECIDGTPPAWMTSSDGYIDAYVFDSNAECCKAHWCES